MEGGGSDNLLPMVGGVEIERVQGGGGLVVQDGGSVHATDSLLPEVSVVGGAQIERVQGGGGGSDIDAVTGGGECLSGKCKQYGWYSVPLLLPVSVQGNPSAGAKDIKSLQKFWKQIRSNPSDVLVANINSVTATVYIIAPLRGDKTAAQDIISWAWSILTDPNSYLIFNGSLRAGGTEKDGDAIEGMLSYLLSRYPGQVLCVGCEDSGSSICSVDGVILHALPHTSRQIFLGSIPSPRSVSDLSEVDMGEVTFEVMEVNLRYKLQHTNDMFSLTFKKPRGLYNREKEPMPQDIRADRVWGAPPGWVTRIEFQPRGQAGGKQRGGRVTPRARFGMGVGRLPPVAAPPAASAAPPPAAPAATVAAPPAAPAATVAAPPVAAAGAAAPAAGAAAPAAAAAAAAAPAASSVAAPAASSVAAPPPPAPPAPVAAAPPPAPVAAGAPVAVTTSVAAAPPAPVAAAPPPAPVAAAPPPAPVAAGAPVAVTTSVAAAPPAPVTTSVTASSSAAAASLTIKAPVTTSGTVAGGDNTLDIITPKGSFTIGHPENVQVQERWHRGQFTASEQEYLEKNGFKIPAAEIEKILLTAQCDTEPDTEMNPKCEGRRSFAAYAYALKLEGIQARNQARVVPARVESTEEETPSPETPSGTPSGTPSSPFTFPGFSRPGAVKTEAVRLDEKPRVTATYRLLTDKATLLKATESGDLAKVQEVLQKSVDLNTRNTLNRKTPLIIACENGYDDIVRALIEKGALQMHDTTLVSGMTALGFACSSKFTKSKQCVEVILDFVTQNRVALNLNLQNNGKTYLMLAASAKNAGALHELLVHQDIEPKLDLNLQTPAIKGIVQEGDGQRTALMFAVDAKCSECINLLLENGADPNMQSQKGSTALMLACVEPVDMEVVNALLPTGLGGAAGAAGGAAGGQRGGARLKIDVNVVRDDCKTALLLACDMKSQQVSQQLIERLFTYGADLTLVDEKSSTPLMILSKNGNLAVISTILDLLKPEYDGPFEPAKTSTYDKILDGNKQLAYINYKTADNHSALSVARKNNHKDIADVLVQRGATAQGRTWKNTFTRNKKRDCKRRTQRNRPAPPGTPPGTPLPTAAAPPPALFLRPAPAAPPPAPAAAPLPAAAAATPPPRPSTPPPRPPPRSPPPAAAAPLPAAAAAAPAAAPPPAAAAAPPAAAAAAPPPPAAATAAPPRRPPPPRRSSAAAAPAAATPGTP